MNCPCEMWGQKTKKRDSALQILSYLPELFVYKLKKARSATAFLKYIIKVFIILNREPLYQWLFFYLYN